MSTPPSIMVIEDNQDDFEAIERGFRSAEFLGTIEYFNSSVKALDHLTNLNHTHMFDRMPGLIILDLNLPGLDGRQLLSIIKSTLGLKTIPVVIFTTSSNQKDLTFCYENGANSYIQKPINFEIMKQICKSLTTFWYGVSILPNIIVNES